MALGERADLVARLSLDDRFSGKLRGAQGALSKFEGSLGRIAGHANRGLKNAATNVARIGVVASGFVALNVQRGIQSLAELEDATTSVDGAIKELGLTGKLTSQQIAGWANEIERDVQAAFDDKEITQAATTLLRFGKVTTDNLRPALVVMTDLATKTGDIGSASSLLAKALADPTKAAGKLARVGIVLTKEQQKQIKAFEEAGDAAGAQKVILDALTESTKGAAAAAKGPYNDALNTLKDVTEDAQRALGEAFLPLLGRVADKLSTFVGDPQNIEKLRGFGRDLADGFEKVLELGGRIPWGLIGESLTTAGKGAKAIFDAFTMLPPWVQQAVITGWGLNKLTGGALGSIVGELGKGLIRGVLGINAGVVNVNGRVVNGGGAVGGGGGVRDVVGVGIAGAVVGAAAMDVGTIATGFQRGYEASQQGDVQGTLDAQRDILENVLLMPPGLRELGQLITGEQQAIIDALKDPLVVKPTAMSPDERQEANDQRQRLIKLAQKGDAQRTATERAKASIDWTRQSVTGATRDGTAAIVSAIRANRTVVNIAFSSTTVRRVSGSTVDWRYRDRKYVPI